MQKKFIYIYIYRNFFHDHFLFQNVSFVHTYVHFWLAILSKGLETGGIIISVA